LLSYRVAGAALERTAEVAAERHAFVRVVSTDQSSRNRQGATTIPIPNGTSGGA